MIEVKRTGKNTFEAIDPGVQFTAVKVTGKRHPIKHRVEYRCELGCHNCGYAIAVRNFVKTERQLFIQKLNLSPPSQAIISQPAPVLASYDVMPVNDLQNLSTVDHDSTKPTVKSILDQVVWFLNQNNTDSRDLWAILTALRGPDSNDMNLKDATTSRLRNAVGLKNNCNGMIIEEGVPFGLNNIDINDGSVYNADQFIMENANNITRSRDKIQHHFVHHYTTGLKALIKLGYLKQEVQ